MQIPREILETAAKILRARAQRSNTIEYREHYLAKAELVETWIGREFDEQQEIEAVKQLVDLQAISFAHVDIDFRIVR